MEEASSDLRTGLPRQMIEVHEPLRLQIVVEASTEVLAAIYQRQPSLRELIGGDWVHVIARTLTVGDFRFSTRHVVSCPGPDPCGHCLNAPTRAIGIAAIPIRCPRR
ncbi:MAG: putative inorganic carbon transporter subunit DabA [Candidatus Competibacteraceae bacterium]